MTGVQTCALPISEGKLGIRFFDTYHIAASRMIEGYFGHEKRRGLEELDIVGFGKFGSDLLEFLAGDMQPDETFLIRVVDRADREKMVNRYARHLQMEERVRFLRSDIRDLPVEESRRRVFFLCTDDDLGNLSLALSLTERVSPAAVYVRMDHWPLRSVSQHLGREHGIVFLNINDLIVQGLKDINGIFKAAEEKDLKRLLS